MRFLIGLILTAGLAWADVSGTWSGSFIAVGPDGQEHDNGATLMLKQSGSELTGTAGPNADQQNPIQKGKVEGDKIAFEVPLGEGILKFDLTVEGEHIKGTVTATMGEQRMSAKLDVTRSK